jgi:S1-C subfamily serine protease
MNTYALRTYLLSAVIGGAVVAAVLLLIGVGETTKTTTVIQQSPLGAAEDTAATQSGLTAREIYKRDAPGVVNVRAQIVQQVDSPFDPFGQGPQGVATGSGFVLDKSGHILTNAHVIEGASRVSVQFEDNKTVEAKVEGKDTSTDIALLKVDKKGLDLKPLELGNSKTVQVGDPTVAIGNPFGLDRTLTTGVVSALQRKISAPNGYSISNVIQTDAAINPGNSGGPLIDATGRVIGINSQIATGGSGGGNVGIGFAVPVNTAKQIVPQLKDSGSVKRAYLGITGQTIDRSLDRLNLSTTSGVLVQTVQSGSPAAKAGLRGGDASATLDGSELRLGGDVIKKIDDTNVKTMDQVISTVGSKKPGETVTIEYLRGGKTKTAQVKLAQRPSESPVQQ